MIRTPPRWIVLAALLVFPGGCERRRADVEPAVASADDDAALRTLFDQAEACGDRYHCPPLTALQERAERKGETRVLEVAFDIMSDPKIETFERMFKMASATARAWVVARVPDRGKMSIEDERVLRPQVMRLLARQDNAVPAHSFVEYLSDARAIFQREALDLSRGNDEVHSAIRGLSSREHDLSTVQAWLGAKDERSMIAGGLLLDALDHATIRTPDEVTALLAFAHRTDSDPEAARIVAAHAVGHDDPAFRPVLDAFARHPEAAVRALVGAPPATP